MPSDGSWYLEEWGERTGDFIQCRHHGMWPQRVPSSRRFETLNGSGFSFKQMLWTVRCSDYSIILCPKKSEPTVTAGRRRCWFVWNGCDKSSVPGRCTVCHLQTCSTWRASTPSSQLPKFMLEMDNLYSTHAEIAKILGNLLTWSKYDCTWLLGGSWKTTRYGVSMWRWECSATNLWWCDHTWQPP